MSIQITRTTIAVRPDHSRVLLRPFNPGNVKRTWDVAGRILALPESQVQPLLDEVLAEFSPRHPKLGDVFLKRFEQLHKLRIVRRKTVQFPEAADRFLLRLRVFARSRRVI